MTPNFDLAPPPATLGSRTAVPIDLSSIHARLVFDGASSSATGEATLRFVVGAAGGCPIFDCRQAITGVALDGIPLPPAQVLRMDLGGGPGAQVRVLDSVVAARSAHELRLTYRLGPPDSPAGGSYPPAIVWSAGPRLRLTFGFTDLVAARYLEAWVPANLIWDQYSIHLELLVVGTGVPHRVLTNGEVTVLGANHWTVDWPGSSTALSPLLEIRPSETLISATTTLKLPVSGSVVTIEAIRPTNATETDLAAALDNLSTWLAANERSIGRYLHGRRFTAFLIQGGMEYDGACTATPGSLEHEVFHSWWGRGVKPASQPDAWWDEGWNVYHDRGGSGVQPFDFSEPPVSLSPRQPYVRVTPSQAYTVGARFFAGVAALTSPESLTSWMNDFYRDHLARPTTTAALEAHIVSRSGSTALVDAFHRWVYGFEDPASPPDLWLSGHPKPAGATPVVRQPEGVADVWFRHEDDSATTPQQPRTACDNWMYARVRNHGAGTAQHFLVVFQVQPITGRRPGIWPADFLPSTTAAVGFDLAPGQGRVVRARWPAALVPPAGTRIRCLAAVIARFDAPPVGTSVEQHGNLAQTHGRVVAAGHRRR